MKKLKSKFIGLKPEQRLYSIDKPLIGLTGGIATGKSSASHILSHQGFAIIDADKLVKKIYQRAEVIQRIREHYPTSINSDGKIDFSDLRKIAFQKTKELKKIESLIYQYLPGEFFLAKQEFQDFPVLFYDIPLLFEKNLKDQFDLTVLVYAPREVQIERVMKRDRISRELALDIIQKQIDIETKYKKADIILNNSKDDSFDRLKKDIQTFLESYFEDY